jgi:hypothetical protein
MSRRVASTKIRASILLQLYAMNLHECREDILWLQQTNPLIVTSYVLITERGKTSEYERESVFIKILRAKEPQGAV